jgi:hypothetical protein
MDRCFCLYEAPIRIGIAITLSPFSGPTAECAAKAAGLRPNNSHALIKAAHHAPNTK